MTSDGFSKIIRNFILTVALTLLLLFVTGIIPVLTVVCFVCCGVPMAVFASKYDLKIAALALIAIFLAYWPMTNHVTNAVTTLVIAVLPGVAAGCLFRRQYPFFSILLTVCALVCLGWILEFVVMDKLNGVSVDDLIASIVAQYNEMINAAVERIAVADIPVGDINPNQLAQAISKTVGDMIRIYFPTFIVLLSMIMGYVSLRICSFAIRKTKTVPIEIVPFSMMRAPRSMSYVAIIIFLINIFSTPLTGFWAVLANVQFILYTIIGICGFSCVDFWLGRAVKPAALRVLIYVAAIFTTSLFFSLVAEVLIIIGILDSGRDFRKIGELKQ